MATSHIPIYYENQLVGSISIAEFISKRNVELLKSALKLLQA